MLVAKPTTDATAARTPRGPLPKVSVIVASYNGARYLPATLASLQAQSLADIEIVVVDDGSDAPTLDVLAESASGDPRVRVHHARHGGLVATLNTAIGLARAPYIARLDHDDLSRPDRLAQQAAYLDAHADHVAVGSDLDVIDGDGRVIKSAKLGQKPEPHAPLSFPPQPSWLPGPTLMARTEALRTIGGFRREMFAAEDRDICWRLGDLGKTWRIREALVQWRSHGTNTSVTKHLTQMASHALGDLSAVARALGLDDRAILNQVDVGGDYIPIIARYRALIGDRYPVDTYWYYFLMRYRVWQLSGEETEEALVAKVRAHCRANPFDWRRWKLWRRARLFENRDRRLPQTPRIV